MFMMVKGWHWRPDCTFIRWFLFHINIYVSYYFKGPEFVRKHILNKHGDKIEEVKKEVTFFNNFLMDAKRPAMPEMKLPPLPGPSPGTRSFLMWSDPLGRKGVMAVHWWICALDYQYFNSEMNL